jgi:hypothetical protein
MNNERKRKMNHKKSTSIKNFFRKLFSKKESKANKTEILTPIVVVKNRAIYSSADYIEKNISKVMLFNTREMLWDYALSKITIEAGLFCEFGVFSGYSINYFSNKIPHNTFYGFDSFEGLQEDWVGTSFVKSAFNREGILPEVNSNVTLIKGWFDESLPNFLNKNSENFSFIHFDADTYESTALLLDLIGHKILKGTIVVFDEYLGFTNWQNGEYLAWKQFVEKEKINYEYLCFSPEQTAIRII